ncbi:hypothetical protein [Deinococcus geothermalis]|uniref:hypothetical protein n=1 Tax=Deinococcus geothermalis TaxID=68909 RepID=UPI0012FC603D|nr:hypothetical protein [Deinococcus geothermalis]
MQTEALRGFKLTVTPLDARAEEAHVQPDDPTALQQRAGEHAQNAGKSLEARWRSGLDHLRQEARAAAEAVGRIVTGQATQADLALAGKTLKLVADVGDKVAALLKPGGSKKLPGILMDLLPGAVQTLLPGVSLQAVKKGLRVAGRLVSLARDPSIKGVAGLLGDLLGGSTRTGSLPDFLLSGMLGVISGKPFDLGRFLPGALRALSKDLNAHAAALKEPA